MVWHENAEVGELKNLSGSSDSERRPAERAQIVFDLSLSDGPQLMESLALQARSQECRVG